MSVRSWFAFWMCILTPAAGSLCAVGQVILSVPWFGFLICSREHGISLAGFGEDSRR